MKLFFVSALCLLAVGCSPMQGRAPARAASLSLAYAIRASANVCTQHVVTLTANGKAADAVQFGSKCEGLLLQAQIATIATAKAVDAWTDGADFGCKMKKGAEALEDVAKLVGDPIPALQDALTVAEAFTVGCK